MIEYALIPNTSRSFLLLIKYFSNCRNDVNKNLNQKTLVRLHSVYWMLEHWRGKSLSRREYLCIRIPWVPECIYKCGLYQLRTIFSPNESKSRMVLSKYSRMPLLNSDNSLWNYYCQHTFHVTGMLSMMNMN